MRMTIFSTLLLLAAPSFAPHGSYAVVVSTETNGRPDWARVVAALVEKHDADVIFADSLEDAVEPLQQQFPRYAWY